MNGLSGYRVRHNFDRFRPSRWTGDWVRDFGPDNRGVLVISHSEGEAIELAATKLNRDPAFLVAAWDLVMWDDEILVGVAS